MQALLGHFPTYKHKGQVIFQHANTGALKLDIYDARLTDNSPFRNDNYINYNLVSKDVPEKKNLDDDDHHRRTRDIKGREMKGGKKRM
jgi:hypothetical protein